MSKETIDLLNAMTSSFAVFLCMVVVVNIVMMLGGAILGLLAGWAGIHFGMMYFSNIKFWK